MSRGFLGRQKSYEYRVLRPEKTRPEERTDGHTDPLVIGR